MRSRVFVLALSIFATAAPMWSRDTEPKKQQTPIDKFDKQYELLFAARKLILEGRPNDAVQGPISEVIAFFENKYKNEKRKIYCAESQVETLYYLLMAAKDQLPAIAFSCPWATAYYMQGYVRLEMGEIELAKASLEKAVAMSPRNSQYLSELGHIYQLQKNWMRCRELYELAEESANLTSSPDQKDAQLGRAMRGTAYVLVELGKLEDAAKKYEACLKINPKDKMASDELKYVNEQLRRTK